MHTKCAFNKSDPSVVRREVRDAASALNKALGAGKVTAKDLSVKYVTYDADKRIALFFNGQRAVWVDQPANKLRVHDFIAQDFIIPRLRGYLNQVSTKDQMAELQATMNAAYYGGGVSAFSPEMHETIRNLIQAHLHTLV